ncbi:MAG: hypothetical protein E7457_01800 [Ruminococcaceae bacterium]|nr:hypothetical protein [Oscillospiraceae bacterium]
MRTLKAKGISVILVLMMVLSLLPVAAFAENASVSPEFQTILNEEGKLEVKHFKPASDEEAMLLEQNLYFTYGFEDSNFEPVERDHYFMVSDYDDSGAVPTARVARINENWEELESHTVELVFVYDEGIKAQVDQIIQGLPNGEETAPGVYDRYYYAVTDLAMFNYWLNGGDVDDLLFYSEEFKNYIDYKNFSVYIGMGTDAPFYTDVAGHGTFMYDDTAYGVKDLGARMDHILYVADGAADLKAAAQARLDAYLGEGVVTVVDATAGEAAMYANYISRYRDDKTFEEFVALCGAVDGVITDDVVVESDYRAQYSYEVAEAGVSDSYDDWKVSYMNMVTGWGGSLPTAEGLIDMPGLTTASPCFKAEVNGQIRYFQVKADSSKMVTPAYQNVDVGTEIAVSTEETSVPLDTMLQVEQLTEGTEYDEIMSVLDVEESVTYDIKLHSASKNQYVTQLPSGKFLVKIPVPAELEGKDLIVYYVNANGEADPYDVTPEDGYAVFETDHFSIYTLADKSTESGAGDITHDTEADKNVGSATLTEDANLGDKVLTEAEKAQVAQGKDVSVWLEVEEAQPSAEDAALVEAKLGDYELGMHLDVTLWKQLEGETEQKVTETAGKVSITFTVPEKLLNKDSSKVRSYKVIRIHDGAAELLDAKFDTTKNTVTFETDRFSTYALVYQDAAKGGSPDTGDAGIALYVGMSVLSAMGAAALVLNQKKRA